MYLTSGLGFLLAPQAASYSKAEQSPLVVLCQSRNRLEEPLCCFRVSDAVSPLNQVTVNFLSLMT